MVYQIMDRLSERKKKNGVLNVGVVYVLGTIGDVGEFGTGAIVKGLKEAGEDDSIGTVVLRIDSGGGGVVESDTIWGAVKDLKAKGKVVVASFGNAAASGGYLIATHADSIFASPSTITGSIGVASLRPTVTPSFFERIKLTTQSFFTGSNSLSLYHELEGEDLTRHKAHIDAAYQDFKARVCDGRQISPALIDKLAGGRVYTGLKIWDLVENLQQPGEKLGAADKPISKSLNDEEPEISTPTLRLDSKTGSDSPISKIQHPASLIPSDTELLADVLGSDEKTPDPRERITVELSTSGGPLGRGIIDGIGGIRDAAIHGVETYLARLLSQTREADLGNSPEEIMEEVLPGISYAVNDDGQVVMSFDIRLKKFPVHKTFWQQLSEASQRGDSIEGSGGSLAFLVKRTFTHWMARSMLHLIESEVLGPCGIKRADVSELAQLMKDARQKNGSSLRAQMTGINLE